MTTALLVFLMGLGGPKVAAADDPKIPTAWIPIQTELTAALRHAFRAMDAPEFDEPTHRRRVCEVLWALDLEANRQSPRYWTDPSSVVTRALKLALDDEPAFDATQSRRIAEFVSKVVTEAQLKPGTIWTEISAPEFAERRQLIRAGRILAATTFGGLTAWTIYDHAWLMTGLSSLIGLAAVGAMDEREVLNPRNRVRPALLECEAQLWRRARRSEDRTSDSAA